jgi:hypothetical protein
MATKRRRRTAKLAFLALATAAATAVARVVRRPRELPAHAIPAPVDSNDDDGHRRGATPSTDATGVAGVLDRATAAGYVAVFEPEPGAMLRCRTCDAVSEASTFERQWQNRLEGASDPDDMAQVSGLVCPACGARGTFVSLFGPGAGTDAAEVMVALPKPLGELPVVAPST